MRKGGARRRERGRGRAGGLAPAEGARGRRGGPGWGRGGAGEGRECAGVALPGKKREGRRKLPAVK